MSDPSVQRMTYAQWLFEFHALQAKEEAEVNIITSALKALFVGLRNVLIQVFGLNLIKKWPDEHKDSDVPPFVPASFIFGRPDALKAILDESAKEDSAEVALQDEAFEALSAKLAKGDYSDLDPVLYQEPAPGAEWRSPATVEQLASLGVKPRTSARPAPEWKGVHLEDHDG